MVDATTAWILAVGGLLLGALVAATTTYFTLRRRYGDQESVTRLRHEYDEYRTEVREHFVETAKRIDALTHAYKSAYDHLEHGAYRLVGEEELHRRLEDATSREPVTLEAIGQRRLHGPGDVARDGAREPRPAGGMAAAAAASSPAATEDEAEASDASTPPADARHDAAEDEDADVSEDADTRAPRA